MIRFFRGNTFVTNKDKVTQPSSALRHSTELTEIVCTHFSDDSLSSAKPVLVIVSDRGPDHRCHFWLCSGSFRCTLPSSRLRHADMCTDLPLSVLD